MLFEVLAMYQYNVFPENKEYFLQFLDAAKVPSIYNNLRAHQIFKEYYPQDYNVHNNYENIIKKCETIDLTESDEEITLNNFDELEISVEVADTNDQSLNDSAIHDTIHSIKESLLTQKQLSHSIINNLNNSDISKIFCALSEDLNYEEVLNFGLSLKSGDMYNELVVSHYIKYLLLKQLSLEYSDQLQDLLNDYSVRFSDKLMEEMTNILLGNEIYSKIFLQFLDRLNLDFKQKLLRKFIITCEKLEENCIPILEILITTQLDVDTGSKLFEKIASSESNFNTNKSFGKLVMTILKVLGKTITFLEQPLKHIIGSHKTIWKSKLQKKFDECLQENSMFSQSFQC